MADFFPRFVRKFEGRDKAKSMDTDLEVRCTYDECSCVKARLKDRDSSRNYCDYYNITIINIIVKIAIIITRMSSF